MKHADASPAVEIDVDVDAEDAAEIAAETEALTVNTADERLAYRGVFQRLLIRPEIGAIIGAAAIWVFFWAVADTFGVATGFANIMDVAAPLGIMAVAVSLLMIGGEFDLSSGAATGALGIVTILLVKDIGELGGAGLSLWIAIPLSLIVALGLGYFNGTMVERTGLPSFIVTLATFFILRGFKLGFSKLIIDNISVGRIDEASGRGYEFWKPIFDGVWARNDHQLGVPRRRLAHRIRGRWQPSRSRDLRDELQTSTVTEPDRSTSPSRRYRRGGRLDLRTCTTPTVAEPTRLRLS